VYSTVDDGKLAKVFTDWPTYKIAIDKADQKYPRLSLTFDQKEIEWVSNLITADNLLDPDMMKSATEKLLYAILWKRGDLQKVRHVIEGMRQSSSMNDKKEQLVFYQFGHHLFDRKQPIIDVNVLKAYAIYTKDKSALIKSGISKGQNGLKLTTEYVQWYDRITNGKNYHFELDRIMFAIGQQINLPQ
jgi:hypothetical protein